MAKNDKVAKSLEVMKEINKQFGANKIRRASEEPAKESLPWACEPLNGFCKGLVKGNFSVLWGGNSVGKSTLAYQTIGLNQKDGKVCCLVDAEHNFNIDRAVEMGINLEELWLIEDIDTAEEAMDMIIALCKKKVVDLFVIDSVQAMSPEAEQMTKKEKLKSIADDEMAALARKLSKFFRVCATPLYQANAHMLLIGQVRKNLGGFIVLDSLSGGCAQDHWAVAILNMRRGQGADAPSTKVKETVTDAEGNNTTKTVDVKLGHDCVFKINKTKVNGGKPEGSEIHVPFYFTSGFLPPTKEVNTTAEPSEETEENKPKKSKKGKE